MSSAAAARRPDNLALALQEALTVVERLRSHRMPVTDASSFRHQMRQALQTAEQQARNWGYSGEETKLAIFAVVAFLDESVLNLRLPVFAEWHKQPLQEELFGHHIAGEVFFQNLERLLAANDSPELADLIEVYELCLLLGFAGRYSLGGRGELANLIQRCRQKIDRIRGVNPDFSPAWALPAGEASMNSGADPWVRRLTYAAVGCLVLMLLLFVAYKVSLGGGVSDVAALATR